MVIIRRACSHPPVLFTAFVSFWFVVGVVVFIPPLVIPTLQRNDIVYFFSFLSGFSIALTRFS